jgi:hypothetical protein
MKAPLFLFFVFFCTVSYSQSSFIRRKLDLIPNNSISFSYVYKNGAPYGTSASVTYNDFYKTYTVSFYKQNGEQTGCQITEANFISTWEFKYNGYKYTLTNSRR